jgi:phage tail-like protein
MGTLLARGFRFQLKLRRSAAGESGKAGAAASASLGVSASASVGFGASASASASIGVGVSLGAGAGGGGLTDGAFQEVSGLEIELDVQEYQEGGRNDGVIRRVGRAKYQNLVLKRGMLYSDGGAVDRELWIWLQGIASGERPVRRYDGVIEVLGTGSDVVATWVFDRGLPVRLRGPELNAKTGEIAIEELHIAHEGLRLVEG